MLGALDKFNQYEIEGVDEKVVLNKVVDSLENYTQTIFDSYKSMTKVE